ncbi:hypothetical protein, partial [Streptomyces boncukensis]
SPGSPLWRPAPAPDSPSGRPVAAAIGILVLLGVGIGFGANSSPREEGFSSKPLPTRSTTPGWMRTASPYESAPGSRLGSGRYTIVHLSTSPDGGAAGPSVRSTLRKAALASDLDGKVSVVSVDSDSLGSGSVKRRYPNVVAVIGDTERTGSPYSGSRSSYSSPVTIDTCRAPGEDRREDIAAGASFSLSPSTTDVAARLRTYLRDVHDVHRPLIGDDALHSDLTRALREGSRSGWKPEVLDSDTRQPGRDTLARDAERADADAAVLPNLSYSGPLAPKKLLESGFRGPVLVPFEPPPGCNRAQRAQRDTRFRNAASEGLLRYRSGPAERGTETRERDAALLLAEALKEQSGKPSTLRLRRSLGRELAKTEVRGSAGRLSLDGGYARSSPLWIDRFDGEKWRVERKLSAE